MVAEPSTILLASFCLAGAIGYVFATWKAVRPAAVMAKIGGSTSFVVLACVNAAVQSQYGRAILVALVLSWVGDLLLLSRQSRFLLAGIGAFLLAHIAFAAAFVVAGIDVPVLAISLALTGILAALILKWLSKYLAGLYLIAVPIYLMAVVVMTSLATAASFRSLPAFVIVAAFAFAVSDISVARDRFIERDVVNKAWGLPLYYGAQIMFAMSVASIG